MVNKNKWPYAVHLNLTNNQYEHIKKKSDDTGIPMTSIIRLMINQEIKKCKQS